MVLAAIGVGIAALGSTPLIEASESASDGADRSRDSEAPASLAVGPPTTVKVLYFQMPQLVADHQEHIVLQSPADFSELLRVVTSRHPALAGMIPSMMVLIDGDVARASTQLKDGDEVDFIPAYAGG